MRPVDTITYRHANHKIVYFWTKSKHFCVNCRQFTLKPKAVGKW